MLQPFKAGPFSQVSSGQEWKPVPVSTATYLPACIQLLRQALLPSSFQHKAEDPELGFCHGRSQPHGVHAVNNVQALILRVGPHNDSEGRGVLGEVLLYVLEEASSGEGVLSAGACMHNAGLGLPPAHLHFTASSSHHMKVLHCCPCPWMSLVSASIHMCRRLRMPC